jgi:hypothetical protein
MIENGTRGLVTIALVVVSLGLSGCEDFLTVPNPNAVNAGEIDPVSDARALALSTQQDFKQAWGDFIVEGGWFAGEILSADINAPGNLWATRVVDQTLSSEFPELARAVALGTRVSEQLEGTEVATSIHAARAALFTGWSFVAMAEYYCEGVVNGGPALTTAMMLESAVDRFSQAIDISRGLGPGEAQDFVNAGLVGRARANLQLGRTSEASADAGQVEEGFVYNLTFVDDLANRTRLSNRVWDRTFGQSVVSVHPDFRDLNDPRVTVIPPEVNKHNAMDGQTEIWGPGKYTSYNDPIRLASKLEADYIDAHAQGPAAQFSLVQARREANDQPPYDGPMDDRSVFIEFMDQYSLDFYLEGKRMLYFRADPFVLRGVQPPGTPYHKVGYEPYSATTCWPLPFKEIANNPNFQGG